MWFEALPSYAIVMGCLIAPHLFFYASNLLALGNSHKRRLDTYDDAVYYLRDRRISGINSAYKQVGLECMEEVEVVEPPKTECK